MSNNGTCLPIVEKQYFQQWAWCPTVAELVDMLVDYSVGKTRPTDRHGQTLKLHFGHSRAQRGREDAELSFRCRL
jgi:hypothetical protein